MIINNTSFTGELLDPIKVQLVQLRSRYYYNQLSIRVPENTICVGTIDEDYNYKIPIYVGTSC